MKAKCLIVDDEPLAANVIINHINKVDSLEVVGTCSRASEAFNMIKSTKVDLLFLDIEMPGISGLEFLKSLNNPPKVIITTAYREYALEGYELDVLDYLLKPISFDRFLKAVNKYLDSDQQGEVVLHNTQGYAAPEGFLYIKANKRVHKVLLKNIIYLESQKDYVKIYTGNKEIVTKQALTTFEEKLEEQHFIRIHRSFIVSLEHITGFTASTIEINEKELPIGRNYRQQVFNALNYNKLGE